MISSLSWRICKRLSSSVAFAERLRQVVDDYLTDPALNVEFLGGKLQLSRTQLFRRVKAVAGKGPLDYIRERRLIRADQLLHTTDMTIQQVALELCFSSPGYFTKCYNSNFVAKYVPFVAVKHQWHILQHYFLRMCLNRSTFAAEFGNSKFCCNCLILNYHEKQTISCLFPPHDVVVRGVRVRAGNCDGCSCGCSDRRTHYWSFSAGGRYIEWYNHRFRW